MDDAFPMDLSWSHHGGVEVKDIKSEFQQHSDCYEQKTYADLEPICGSKHKQLLTCCDNTNLQSWKALHPDNWTSKEVVDWMYSCVYITLNNAEGGLDFQGEQFRELNGAQLCQMTLEEFEEKEPQLGKELYIKFQQLREDATFMKPLDTECSDFNLDDISYPWIDSESDDSMAGFDKSHFVDPALICQDLDSFILDSECEPGPLAIDNDSYWLEEHALSEHSFSECGMSSDIDSGLGSDTSSPSHSPSHQSGVLPSFGSAFSSSPQDLIMNKLPQRPNTPLLTPPPAHSHHQTSNYPVSNPTPTKRPRGRPPKVRDANGQFPVKAPSTRGRKPGQASKGNHLWEFIRDLLLNPDNNHLIKWENYKEGIFRILKSEEVAKLWGDKKNNKTMSYEKMSRAMRFCRTAGYFEAVPKTGIYPKKLCFKFGQDSYGWRKEEAL